MTEDSEPVTIAALRNPFMPMKGMKEPQIKVERLIGVECDCVTVWVIIDRDRRDFQLEYLNKMPITTEKSSTVTKLLERKPNASFAVDVEVTAAMTRMPLREL